MPLTRLGSGKYKVLSNCRTGIERVLHLLRHLGKTLVGRSPSTHCWINDDTLRSRERSQPHCLNSTCLLLQEEFADHRCLFYPAAGNGLLPMQRLNCISSNHFAQDPELITPEMPTIATDANCLFAYLLYNTQADSGSMGKVQMTKSSGFLILIEAGIKTGQ